MNSELPPSGTVKPIDPPPLSGDSTTAQLKADIDSGRTGDKVPVFDPGLSPLGTDDEAAGTPAGPNRIALARRTEGIKRWIKGSRRTGHAHNESDPALLLFLGFIVLVGAVFAAALVLV